MVHIRVHMIVVGITLVLLFLTGSGDANPSEQWNRTFGDRGEDWVNSVQQTTEGGYILAGQRNFDAWLIKTDANGVQQWSKTFGGRESDWVNSIWQTKDTGYVFVGVIESSILNMNVIDYESNALLIKTDASGGQQWKKEFQEEKVETANSVLQTKDEGYVLAGKYRTGKDTFDALIIKIDSNGSQLWSHIFADDEEADSIQQTLDGGFIVAGMNKEFSTNAFLIKTDASGNQRWRKTFGGKKEDSVNSVHQTPDGYILAGSTRSYGNGSADAWLIKTDTNGKELWSRTFGGAGDDGADSVWQTRDGGYVLAGGTAPDGAIKPDAWIIKTDANGSEQWSKTFGGTESDFASSVQQTSDGGYILSGVTRSYGNGSADAWLIKVSGDSVSAPAAAPTSTFTPTPTIAPATPSTPALTPAPVPPTTAAPKTPGFEAAFAITGMLAITCLMRRII